MTGERLRPEDLGFGTLFDRIRDAVIVADAKTQRIVLWNPAAAKMFGYSDSEALNLRVEALVPDPLKDAHRAGIAHYAETGQGPYIDSEAPLDLPAMTKNGAEIRVEMSLSPINPVHEAVGGEADFVLAIVREVSGRKRAEEAVRQLNKNLENRVEERTSQLETTIADLKSKQQDLLQSEERFRLLVESVSDYAIFMLGPDGHIVSWNEGAERIQGYRRGRQGGIGRGARQGRVYPEHRRGGKAPWGRMSHTRASSTLLGKVLVHSEKGSRPR